MVREYIQYYSKGVYSIEFTSEYGGEGEPLSVWIDLMLCRNFVKKLREPGTDHYRANLK